jgi:hypothetical protein
MLRYELLEGDKERSPPWAKITFGNVVMLVVALAVILSNQQQNLITL